MESQSFAFRTLKPKILDVAVFPALLLLSGINSLLLKIRHDFSTSAFKSALKTNYVLKAASKLSLFLTHAGQRGQGI